MKPLRVAALGLAASACSRQAALDPAGDEASRLHGLLNLMLWIGGGAYLLVLAFLGWALWRARRRFDPSPEMSPNDGALNLGLGAWAALITVALVVVAAASFLVDRSLARADAASQPDIRVTAHQWWWRLEYRDPTNGRWIETANELRLPAGRPTRLEIRSADVIHSFWIPSLSGKIDMVPGRINRLTLTPRRTGWLRGQCAEFCGLQHARMVLDVKVDAPADYAAWLAGQARPADAPDGPEALRGQALVTGGKCAACHAIRGTPAQARAGPDLTHLASRRSLAAGTLTMSRGSLMGWIAQPQALKPGAEMPPTGLSPGDALAVAAYLERLR